MTDTLTEIWHTIRKNPLRTFLTSLAVAWGIFMLVILLGAGNGIENGVKAEFDDNATNAIWINAGQTSIAHNGLQPGRKIKFTNDDFDEVKKSIPHIDAISAEFWIWQGNTVSYKGESGTFTIRAVQPQNLSPFVFAAVNTPNPRRERFGVAHARKYFLPLIEFCGRVRMEIRFME